MFDEARRRMLDEPEVFKSVATVSEWRDMGGLLQQAQRGDNTTSCPWFWNWSSYTQWHAWNKFKGQSRHTAKEQYSDLWRLLRPRVGYAQMIYMKI